MDKQTEERLKRQIDFLMKDATRYTGKLPRLGHMPSLFQIIRTKKQAERFEMLFKLASGELIIKEASKK